MNAEVPTEDERRALATILMQAFLELRAAPDSPDRVFELADVMHNLPLEMVGAYPWRPDMLRKSLARYREKFPGGPDYVAMLDAIIPPPP